jgi:hypothetical protein
MRFRLLLAVGLALCTISRAVHAQRVAPSVFLRLSRSDTTQMLSLAAARVSIAAPGRAMPTWLKWGLVGAAAGAVTLPLLGSLASDSRGEPARDAFVGAAAGFVIVGGSVALWQALCGPDSSSRRAGLCGG